MKILWKRFRDWLIRKLGGFTKKQHDDMWLCLEALQDENRSLRIQITKLESDLIKKREEIGRLKMELDSNPPAWKCMKEETMGPKIIRAETVIHRHPEEPVDIVGITKDYLARRVLAEAQQDISYHFLNDFEGNSRVIATLRVLVGPGDL